MSTNQSGFDRRTLLRSAAGLSALGIPGVVGGATATRPNQSTGGSNQHCDQTVEAGESIQAAINAADDGDTICIEAGAYEEDLNITRADSLTIRGAGSDEVTIDSSGESGYGVDGVFSSGDWGSDGTLEGFTLIGPQQGTVSQNFGLKLSYIDGLDIEDVHVTGSRRTGIDVFPASPRIRWDRLAADSVRQSSSVEYT